MAKQPQPPNTPRRIPLQPQPSASIIPNTPTPLNHPEDDSEVPAVVEDWDEDETPEPPIDETDEPEKVKPPIDIEAGTPLNKVPAKFRKLL